MDAGREGAEHDVRMNVKVSRRDFPVLTAEIARLPKGPRRTNRLAQLATLGLLCERTVGDGTLAAREVGAAESTSTVTTRDAAGAYRSRLDASHLAALIDDDAAP